MKNKSTNAARRQLLRLLASGAALGSLMPSVRAAATKATSANRATGPQILTTWDFGPGANEVGFAKLSEGASALDAVEAAINHVELLPDEYWVGFGGVPNEIGETTLDAQIMWGPTHDYGAVGCLKRVKRAISVARHVMEKTQHTLIVGDDATRFAVRMGFDETSLTNARSQKVWEEWAARNEPTNAFGDEPFVADTLHGHDTVGTIAIDDNGDLCVGCSTNGREFKIPGRVGDSPIPGAGAYGDQNVGAAVATGNGDVMMRFLPTYHAVELMRSGAEPDEAAREAIKRITDRGYQFSGAVVAMSMDGRHGAAGVGQGFKRFRYAVQTADGARVYAPAGNTEGG